MASSSSAHKLPRHHLLNPYLGTTAAPPPTPSTQSTSDTAAAADTLSRLLHRLPPSLSLPTRLSPRATAPSTTKTSFLPTISLTNPTSLTSSFKLGYFQLTQHNIPTQLAESAESEARALFDLPLDKKHACFPRDWPLGFDDDDGDDDHTASFCLDSGLYAAKTTESAESASLSKLTRELEKLGLHVVEKLACTMGFDNPYKKMGPTSLMWVSSSDGDKVGRVYPYVVGLQYHIRRNKWSLLSDTGSVNVEPEIGSVLVTLGDIAQVWSNGKLKKVRGRPATIAEDTGKLSSGSISMTVLLTLAPESTVSPLLMIPRKFENNNHETEASISERDKEDGHGDDYQSAEASTPIEGNDNANEDPAVFNSFNFEDYAWRVYHERLPLKDPLDRYRITD